MLWACRGFPAEKRTKKSQAPTKLAQPFPALEQRAEKLQTSLLFFLIVAAQGLHHSFSGRPLSGRIKCAANCGCPSVSPFPPSSRRGLGPLPVPETPFFFFISVEISTLSRGSPLRIHCFAPPGDSGRKVSRNDGSQNRACIDSV